MTAPAGSHLDAEDHAAVAALNAAGYLVSHIPPLARDQSPFAVRSPRRADTIAPGVRLDARTVELGDGCFTNTYCLDIDLAAIQVAAVSSADGFHLPDLVNAGSVAAVSGTFEFISDDPAYQPAEPCLELCVRHGEAVSVPTATKPALLVQQGRPVITTLEPAGTLSVNGRSHRWVGSRSPHATPKARRSGEFTVFGAANCQIRYTDHQRTGFARDVDPTTNRTPKDPDALDYTVSWTHGAGHRIASVHPDGGADLFTGALVLRADRTDSEHLAVGAPVRITGIDELDVRDIDAGFSVGPSVADAAAGYAAADACLGLSPFTARRSARTLIGLRDQHLRLAVLDGAPRTTTFQGVSPAETAELCTAWGWDPHKMYHLDGGQSSKIAYRKNGQVRVLGSMHYLRWPHGSEEPFRWQGHRGRVLHSGLALTPGTVETVQWRRS